MWFDKIHLLLHSILEFSLLGGFWLLIKTNYLLLLIFLSCIFLLNSNFIGCMFLRIYPLFFQDCPIWWYRIVPKSFLWALYFCAPVISFSDIKWFFLLQQTSFLNCTVWFLQVLIWFLIKSLHWYNLKTKSAEEGSPTILYLINMFLFKYL